MAQIVKLRRSSVSGQKPTNTNLQLGELAMNTTDGKVFLAKSGSGGGASIEEIVTTNTVNTGSLNIIGPVTASYFVGDGAGVTNVISSSYAVSSSYANLAFTIQSVPGATQLLTVSSPSTSWVFNHNLGEQFPVVQVYDSNGYVVIPTSIEMLSANTTVITFSLAQSGYATATVGGGLPAISGSYTNRLLRTDGIGASWSTLATAGIATTGSNQLNGNQIITGSVDISTTLKLTQQHPLPTGTVGTLAVSGSNLFFHNGSSWQQVI